MNINLDKGYKLFFVATFNNEIYISLPSDKKVSLNQVALLYKLLNQIEEYNKQEKVVKAKVKALWLFVSAKVIVSVIVIPKISYRYR